MAYDPWHASLWRMLAILVALAALAGGTAVAAPVDAAFTVRNVAVDATAESAAAAREEAIAEGQRHAWDRLIARLVPKEDQARVPRVSARDLTELVRDFEVNAEKASEVRYLANLQIRFKPEAVRTLLRGANVPFAISMSDPLVVLPVLRSAAALLLWDDPNPWRAAWQAAPPADGLVPLIEPKGDNADVATIGPEQAVDRDPDQIGAIAKRYSAAGALVAYATQHADPQTGRPALDVTAVRTDAAAGDQTLILSYAEAAGESDDAFYARAQKGVQTAIEDSWKEANLLHFNEPSGIEVMVPLNGLTDWVAIRRRIAGIPFIQQSGVRSLSRNGAVLSLQYFGDQGQLASALAQRGLALEQGPTGWVLHQSDSASGAAPH